MLPCLTVLYSEFGNRLVAKSMDDRAGVLVAIKSLRALKSTPHDVYFVFTTQEEVGPHAAQPPLPMVLILM